MRRLPFSASAEQGRAADLILSGEARRQSDSFQATIRVETLAPRVIIYSQQFEAAGADSRLLPERIGAQVTAALSWTGALMILDRRHPTDPAIVADLLRNTTLIVQGGDTLQSYEISRRLAPKAPDSPMAQLSLAFNTGFVLEAIPRNQRGEAVASARRAADRAVALAPDFGDVYATWCFLHSPVELRACEDRLRHGMRADPDAPFVPFFLSVQMENVGRFQEALELARMSLANDRYKLWKIARVLRMLEMRGRSAEAEALYRQGNRWWPNHPGLIWNRWTGMIARGDFAAIERFEASLPAEALPESDRTPPELLAAIRRGDLRATNNICGQRPAPSVTCMTGLASLGDSDGAFTHAGKLYPRLRGRTPIEEDALWLDTPLGASLGFLASPAAAPLRRDQRYLALAERVGLLDYWRSGRLPDFCKDRPEPICSKLHTRRG